jgi:hypothetical protein
MEKINMQIKFGLKNDAEAVHCMLDRKKEFFLVVHNFQGQYLPQVRVVLTGPPEVIIRVKSEWYGRIGNGNKKSRLFAIVPKAEGIFNLTATLSSKNNVLLSLPVELRVGDVQIPPKPISQPEPPKLISQPLETNSPKVNNLWAGITLITIGIFIIVGGTVAYYMEEAYCATQIDLCTGPLHSWGGMGLFGLTFLSLIFIAVGIIYPYKRRIRRKEVYVCILLLFLPSMAYLLTWLLILP